MYQILLAISRPFQATRRKPFIKTGLSKEISGLGFHGRSSLSVRIQMKDHHQEPDFEPCRTSSAPITSVSRWNEKGGTGGLALQHADI